jgi:VanZ family protein
MLKLRIPWLWWGCGWLLVAGVSFGSLMPGRYIPIAIPSDKLLHAGTYFILMLWFSGLYKRHRDVAVVGVLLFALGLLLDISQGSFTRRTFDMLDVAANGGGILVAWIIARVALTGWCDRIERLFVV